MNKICLVKSHIFRTKRMPVTGLYRNRRYHVPFWSMIYVALKFSLSVSGLNFISIASKLWTNTMDLNGMCNPCFQTCPLPAFSEFQGPDDE